MKKLLLLFLLAITYFNVNAGIITVINTNDTGAGSLRQAIADAVSGDTVNIDPILISSGSDTIHLTSTISFNKDILIKGVYNATDTLFISGDSSTRIFEITTGTSTIVMDSLVLIECLATGTGSALSVQNEGTTIFKNSVIKYCVAIFGQSTVGYIPSSNSALFILENSEIAYNYSEFGGGAIYAANGKLEVVNSSIHHNSSNSWGGGIYTGSSDSLKIINSTFYNNSASSSGGAIYFLGSSTTHFFVKKSSFINNSSNQTGGAIYSGGTPLIIDSTTIDSNRTTGSNGGGLYVTSNVLITNSTISNNVSGGTHYGGFYVSDTIGIYNSTLTGNRADNIATGLAQNGMTIINSTISKNIATTTTGGINVNSGNITIKGSILAHNTAPSLPNIGTATINSLGYNIFEDAAISGVPQSSDQLGVSLGALNLDTLNLNGGTTKTLLPMHPSVAIDMGDPSDLSDAQNGGVTNIIREVGAAENCATASYDTVTVCDSLVSPSGNHTWTTTGNFTDTLLNAISCDSIIFVNLTVNYTSRDTITQTVCDSLVSPSGNYTWTSTGVYIDTILNMSGCDSVMTFNLTVGNATSATITQFACDSLVSPSGNYTWASTGTYMDTITNASGCDSVMTFNLTVNTTVYYFDTLSFCKGDSTLVAGTWIYQDTVIRDTLVSSSSCDSVITYTINKISITTTPNLGADITICNNDTAIIYAGVYDSYLWNTGDTTSSISVNGNVTGVGTFTYWVEVGDTNIGCTERDSILIDVIQCVGIEEALANSLITIYPNPVTEQTFTINFGAYEDDCVIEVLDVTGKLLSKASRQNQTIIEMNIDGERGVYFIKFISLSNKKIAVTKIVKH